MELKAVMKWICRLKSRDAAGSSLGTKQALITQLRAILMELSKQESGSSASNNQEAEQAGFTQLTRQ